MRIIQVLLVLLIPSISMAQQPDADQRVAAIVAEVSEPRLQSLLETLASFRTRHTSSDADAGGQGIGAARQWIFDEMSRSSPRLRVAYDSHRIPPQGQRVTREVEIRNVVAVLPGRSSRRIYVGGHYDSRTVDVLEANAEAPGANDNGSGTVLTMELARVFAESGVEFDATLVFIAFAGEEQGLLGALLHAQRAVEEGVTIDAVLNNDMVGGIAGGNGIANGDAVRVFSEGPEDSASRQLARYIRTVAARYVPAHRVQLIARRDRYGRGGDHTAFNQYGFAAVRFTEVNENFEKQHNSNDTLDGVSFTYLARNARVNAAALAELALAPPAPTLRLQPRRTPSGYDATLTWEQSPGAVNYRLYWRGGWTPDWEHAVTVGNVTSFTLPGVSIDDHVFGVAAVGADGNESLVSAYVMPERADTVVEGLPQ